jgi:hypothetical protein
MIKTFEEFNNDILCEAYTTIKPKVIKELNIYSESDNNGICKTWEDVLKLFSNPKYNVACASSTITYEYDEELESFEQFDETRLEKCDGTVLQVLKEIGYSEHVYIDDGVICIENGKEELIKLYILTIYGKKAQRSTNLSKPMYHTKVRMDLVDWYNDPTNFDENDKEDDNKESDDTENDAIEKNAIKDLILYDDYPTSDNKPNRTWEEAIQILSNTKYNVKCAVLRLEKNSYGKYKYIYNYKEYRYNNDDVRREDSIVEEIERIQNFNKGVYKAKYKRIAIYDGAIIYTAQIKGHGEYMFLMAPLNDQGKEIKKWENEDIFDPKYRIVIEKDIFDDSDTTTNKYIQKIKSISSKEDIDSILKNAFKSTSQEQYSIISACTLCREIELGIWEPTDINGEDIIKAIEERFGITYSTEK